MKRKIVLLWKKVEEKIMNCIYTLGYAFVAEPKPEKYRIKSPLDIIGAFIMAVIIFAVLLTSTAVAIIVSPLLNSGKSDKLIIY